LHIKSNYSLFFILVSISIFLNYYFAPIGIDLYHDGTQAKSSFDLYNGKIPYLETYVEYGALTLYFNSIFLKIFGTELIVLKYLAGFYNFLLHMTFYSFCYLFFKNIKIAFCLTLSLILFENYMDVNYFDISNTHLTILLFMMSVLSFYCFIRFKITFYIYILSFLLTLSFFNKINYAVYSYIAFSIIFILCNFNEGFYNNDKNLFLNFKDNLFKRFSLRFQISFSIFFLILIFILISKGVFKDWFIQTFINSIGVASSSRPFPQLLLELFPIPFIARQNPLYNYIYFIAAISYIPFLIKNTKIFLKKKYLDDHNFEIFTLSILALFLHLNYNPIIDTWHFYWSSPLLLFFIYLLIDKITNILNINFLKIKLFIYFLILIPAFIFLLYKTYINKLVNEYTIITDINFLNGMKVKKYEYNFFNEINQEFQTNSGLSETNYIVDLTRYPKSFFLAMFHKKETQKFYFDYKTISNNGFYYDNYEDYLKDFIIKYNPIIISENSHIPSYVNQEYKLIKINSMDEYYKLKPGNNFDIFVPLK